MAKDAEDTELTQEEQFKRVQALISAEVNKAYDARVAEEGRRVTETNKQQEKTPEEQLKDVIGPIFKPDLDEVRLVTADAKDEVRFYRKNPEALEYEEAIEKKFTELVRAGRPTSRIDIYNLIVGNEYNNDRSKFVEKINERTKKELETAEYAGDIGMGGMGKVKPEVAAKWSNFEHLPAEEQDKMMEGVTF